MDDHKLLRGYVRNRSQEAFQELVDRHLAMVYSAARRMVRDPHLAEEVAQNTFRSLAQKARSLRPPLVVAGWLHTTARQIAEHAKTVAHAAAADKTTPAKKKEDPSILEHLDAAIGELDIHDRDALVLRYLENRSLREVELELGVAEDAARLRLNRGLEHLREELGHEGVTVTLVLLTTTLSSNVSIPVPPGLGADVTLAALSATTTAAAGVGAGDEWFNLKSAAVMAVAALLVGGAVYFIQQRFIDRLHSDNRSLLARQQKLTDDRDIALSTVRTREIELQVLRKDADELVKLRTEAAKFNQQRLALNSLQADNKKLRDQLTQPPSSTNKVASFIAKDDLSFVGYETPEAALETATWAMITGNYEEMLAASSQEIQAFELNNTKSHEEFEARQQKLAPVFQGLTLLAKKVLGDDRVEIKVQWNYTDPTGKQTDRHMLIQPLIKVGDEWRIETTRDHDAEWDHDGRPVLTFSP